MKRVYSLPGMALAIVIAIVSFVEGDPQGWIDYFRIFSIALTLYSALVVACVFWRNNRGIDRLPWVAFALLLFARVAAVYDNIGEPSISWYASPTTVVVDVCLLYYVFSKYGDRRAYRH